MIAEALVLLAPGSEWTIDGDSYEGITWLSLDRAGEAINTINQDVLKELESLLKHSDILASKGLVITSAKKKGFIAGADIKQFSQCHGEEDFFEWIEKKNLKILAAFLFMIIFGVLSQLGILPKLIT